jgi:hypothetical protein
MLDAVPVEYSSVGSYSRTVCTASCCWLLAAALLLLQAAAGCVQGQSNSLPLLRAPTAAAAAAAACRALRHCAVQGTTAVLATILSRLNSYRKGSQSRRACRLKEISCCCGSRAADPKPPQLRGFACRLCDPCMGRLSTAVL